MNDTLPIPTEDHECLVFVQWLKMQNGVKFCHVPNETYSPSKSQRGRIARLGGEKGLCDYVVGIRADACKEDRSVLLFVEMKRTKGGALSPEQKDWIDFLNEVGDVQAFDCYGADDAILTIARYLKKPDLPFDIRNVERKHYWNRGMEKSASP